MRSQSRILPYRFLKFETDIGNSQIEIAPEWHDRGQEATVQGLQGTEAANRMRKTVGCCSGITRVGYKSGFSKNLFQSFFGCDWVAFLWK